MQVNINTKHTAHGCSKLAYLSLSCNTLLLRYFLNFILVLCNSWSGRRPAVAGGRCSRSMRCLSNVMFFLSLPVCLCVKERV